MRRGYKILWTNVCIWSAFLLSVIRFAYMYFNRGYQTNGLFTNTMVSVSILDRTAVMMNLGIVILFSLVGMHEFIKPKKKSLTLFAVVLLVLFGVFWTIDSIQKVDFLYIVLCGSVTPMIMVMAFCFYIGHNERLWNTVLDATALVTVVFTAICLFETVNFVLNYGFAIRLMTSGSVFALTMSIMLLYVTLLFNSDFVDHYRWLVFIVIFSLIGCALVLQSRSWAIHAIVQLVIYINIIAKKNANPMLIRLCFIIIIMALLVVFSEFVLVISNSILARVGSDSRTGQLDAFFEQVSTLDLLLGRGIDATYECFGVQYLYLDNLVLLTMFKFGTIPTLMYLSLLLKPLHYGLKKRDPESRKASVVIVAWLAAMLGVSIFVSYSITLYNIVIYILCGRIDYVASQKSRY